MSRTFLFHKCLFPSYSTEENVTCVHEWPKANCLVFACWKSHYAAKLCFLNEKTFKPIKLLSTVHLKSIIQILVVKYKRVSYVITAGRDSQIQITLANRAWKTHGILLLEGPLKKIVYSRKKNLLFAAGKFKGVVGFFLNQTLEFLKPTHRPLDPSNKNQPGPAAQAFCLADKLIEDLAMVDSRNLLVACAWEHQEIYIIDVNQSEYPIAVFPLMKKELAFYSLRYIPKLDMVLAANTTDLKLLRVDFAKPPVVTRGMKVIKEDEDLEIQDYCYLDNINWVIASRGDEFVRLLQITTTKIKKQKMKIFDEDGGMLFQSSHSRVIYGINKSNSKTFLFSIV